MGFKLWEIEGFWREALAAAEESIDQETGEIPEDWAKFLDDIYVERDQKCLTVAAVVRELAAEGDAIAQEAKRLVARSRAVKAKEERLKAYLQTSVKPGEKMKDERVQIGWRKSTAVVIDDDTAIPENCWRVVREVSKTAVKEALQAGTLTAGAHIEERQNLTIR